MKKFLVSGALFLFASSLISISVQAKIFNTRVVKFDKEQLEKAISLEDLKKVQDSVKEQLYKSYQVNLGFKNWSIDQLLKRDLTWSQDDPTLITQEMELLKLSKKLGVSLHNPENIPLYKAVVSWLGTKYKYGGNSRKGIDCSGFTSTIYREVFQAIIDRTSASQSASLVEVKEKDQLVPGDLVFFATNSRRKSQINHVGIYIGDNHFVHASVKAGVRVSSFDEGYYARTFRKAGSILNKEA